MSEGLTILFAVHAGLYASRNIPVSSLLLTMIVGPLLCSSAPAKGFFQRMAGIESQQRGHGWPILALIATFAIAANGGYAGSSLLMNAHFDPQRMPVDAVNYLQKNEVKGPVLSPDFWGGYLIYRLYPRTQVVVDDRHDLYGEEFFKSYLKMWHVEPGWEDFLREHESSCVLLPKNAALTAVLLESGAWKTIYSDDVAVVFVRGSNNP